MLLQFLMLMPYLAIAASLVLLCAVAAIIAGQQEVPSASGFAPVRRRRFPHVASASAARPTPPQGWSTWHLAPASTRRLRRSHESY